MEQTAACQESKEFNIYIIPVDASTLASGKVHSVKSNQAS